MLSAELACNVYYMHKTSYRDSVHTHRTEQFFLLAYIQFLLVLTLSKKEKKKAIYMTSVSQVGNTCVGNIVPAYTLV